MATPNITEEWDERGALYRAKIASGTSSSSWIRDAVLKPEVVRLLGDRGNDRVPTLVRGAGGYSKQRKSANATLATSLNPIA